MKNIVNKILNTLKYILIFLVIIISLIVVTNFMQLKILKKEYPNFFNYSFFVVVTNSMAPTIKTNDIILVKINSGINIGDIITYKKNNIFVTHRVSEIKDKLYIAKGDANNVGDEPISKDIVVGKVIKTFDNLGIWRKVLLTPQVFILLIVTLLLFNGSFRDWTKGQYYRFKDFKITKDSIIEERNEKNKNPKK